MRVRSAKRRTVRARYSPHGGCAYDGYAYGFLACVVAFSSYTATLVHFGTRSGAGLPLH
jgi:hypothetical protein